MGQPRIIIIGAGPAGVRAAEAVVAAGLRPVVIDEGQRDGGQIYRRQPDGFRRKAETLYGSEAGKAEDLHKTFECLQPYIDYLPAHLAWNICKGEVHLAANGQTRALAFDRLIIASGATDRLLPVKGWHYAGVYSLGAAQIALKAQACAIGKQVVFMGTGPLLQLVAHQYAKAGAQIVALLDISPLTRQIRAVPKLLSRPSMLLKGLQIVTGLMAGGIEIHRGIKPHEVHGDDTNGVNGVTVRLASGVLKYFACDAVALGYHLRPETQLADLAGCCFVFDPLTRQFWPEIDAHGRSSVSGVYLAGDGVRTQGADGAEISGELAALAALSDAGWGIPDLGRLADLHQRAKVMERFRLGIVEAYPWPYDLAADLDDETILCRCEGISVGELRAVALERGAGELNRAKAFSRVGMGRCQGRYCGHAAAEVVAAATGLPLQEIGRLRGQAPVKPLPIAARKISHD